MPVLTVEEAQRQVHEDRCATRLVDNHIRSTRSSLLGAGAATVTRNGPTIRAIPNPLPSGVPAYIPEFVEIMSSAATGPILLYEAVLLGSLDCATGTFTDGAAFPTRTALGSSRQLSGQVVVECATDMVSQRTIQVTYVNQDGTGGRSSASHAITVNALKNSTGILVLQAGDTAVQDITAVSASGGTSPTGTLNFWGVIPVAMIPASFGAAMLTKNLLAEGVIRRLAAGTNLRCLQLNTQAAERAIGMLRFVHDTAGSAPTGNKRPLDSVGNLMVNQAAFGELAVGLNVRHTPATTATVGATSGLQTAQVWDRDYVVPSLGAGVDGAVISSYGGSASATTEQVLVWRAAVCAAMTFTGGGNRTYVQGAAMPSRKHYSRASAEQTVSRMPILRVSAAVGGASTPTITISYTNQDGVSGRTCVMTIPSNPAANSAFFMLPHLQAGDSGIISVEDMVPSGGSTGTLEVWGCVDLGADVCFSSGGGQNVQVATPSEQPLLQAGDALNVVRVNAATSVGSFCCFDLIGVAA